MIKMLKEWWLDYRAAQDELSQMGIYHFTTASGIWTHVDQTTFNQYIKKKEQQHEST
jgi:hypothetical protein